MRYFSSLFLLPVWRTDAKHDVATRVERREHFLFCLFRGSPLLFEHTTLVDSVFLLALLSINITVHSTTVYSLHPFLHHDEYFAKTPFPSCGHSAVWLARDWGVSFHSTRGATAGKTACDGNNFRWKRQASSGCNAILLFVILFIIMGRGFQATSRRERHWFYQEDHQQHQCHVSGIQQ